MSASLPADVRAMLVCPRCRGELVDRPSALRCLACALDYPVEEGVPYLVPECARPSEDAPEAR